MLYNQLSMPTTLSGWIFIVLLLVFIVFISIWFDNRFKKSHRDTKAYLLIEESLTTLDDNEEIYKNIDNVHNTSSIVKITYKDNQPISIEKTKIFTTKEGHIKSSELSKRKKLLRKELLDGVKSFDTVEGFNSNYYRDGDYLVGKSYMKQALNDDTESETLIGLTFPFNKRDIRKKLTRSGYEKHGK